MVVSVTLVNGVNAEGAPRDNFQPSKRDFARNALVRHLGADRVYKGLRSRVKTMVIVDPDNSG
jgi:hypothetical protein